MALFWGDKLGEETDGLDILGIRGLDQSLETALANGITTISLRGRYFTVLPWLVGEFFEADKLTGATVFDLDRLRIFCSRVEYLILACTTLDEAVGDNGGALGSVSHRDVMDQLRSGATIPFPKTPRSALLGTYFGPSRAIGLVKTSQSGAPEPIALTPRGKEIWSVRNAAIGEGSLRRLLWEADTLSPSEVRTVTPHFSLMGLSHAKAEAECLRQALQNPWEPLGKGASVTEAYARFVDTLAWLRTKAGQASLQADRLLADNYRRVIDSGASEGGVTTAWAEFEWRRRLHFALELLLSAVCTTLSEIELATISEIIDQWSDASDLPPALTQNWPEAHLAWTRRGMEAVASVPDSIFLETVPIQTIRDLSPHARGSAAVALLAGLAAQSRTLRSKGLFPDRDGAGERVLALVEGAAEEPFHHTIEQLARVVTEAHFATTFRKMANGQKCSLRFFPEGPRLRSTGLSANPGQSGSRLGNIIRVLRDAGFDDIAGAA